MEIDDPHLAPTEAEQRLIDAAWAVRESARCKYSNFAVGAALEADDGVVWTGANVENASYGLTMCAERVALFYALTHGAQVFRRVIIATDTHEPTAPCGACRQLLWEFARDATVMLATRNQVRRMSMRELLPHAFDVTALE